MRELENLVAHLKLRTNSQREAAEAELRNIHNAKVEIEERLAELELRASQLTQSLEMEGRTHRPIDVEALQPLEEALSRPALAKALHSSNLPRIKYGSGYRTGEAPKRVTVKVEPQGLSPRDQPLLRSPVLVSNVLHDSYENSYGYMCERDLLHKRRKKIREADETFEGLDQDSQFTTRPTTLRRTAIQGHETSRLAPDMQTRVKNEMARHVRPSAGQLQPYPPNPFSTDGDDKSTDYGSVPADYEWE
ncbi:hypothetical protein DL98DRAFT_543032 [Cadophora sp. DSE1049]|nr:hypothetical protein DL98DRAFT_543032 [Cadophora sp. DSE1049]